MKDISHQFYFQFGKVLHGMNPIVMSLICVKIAINNWIFIFILKQELLETYTLHIRSDFYVYELQLFYMSFSGSMRTSNSNESANVNVKI